MFKPSEYLSFAAAAEDSAKTANSDEAKTHYLWMAASWRNLERFTAATEACRPGGPCLD